MKTGNTTWRIAADTGGTFTDAIAVSSEGETRLGKVLSSSRLRGAVSGPSANIESIATSLGLGWELPDGFFTGYRIALYSETDKIIFEITGEAFPADEWVNWEIISPEEAPVLAARLITGTPLGQPLPISDFRLATTRGTNALLERRGAKLLFCTTEGFRDLLEIGTQQRPDLFALAIRKTAPLYSTVKTIPERIDSSGDILKPLSHKATRALIGNIKAEAQKDKIESVAICLMHSCQNSEHELLAAQAFRDAGFEFITYSAELSQDIGFLERAQTTVIEAYLAPIMRRYLSGVAKTLPKTGSSLRVMTSVGGLSAAESFRAKDGLLSGPAGGVAGAASVGKIAGETRLITFDMGGTSTDVARYDGALQIAASHTVGGGKLHAPALRIETVAAGGGSICRWDGERLHVGPESAGADPGPACYGRGGSLTITDVNLLLGRIAPDRVSIPLNKDAAEQKAHELMQAMGHTGKSEPLLEGLLNIADEIMADAIRRISVREGYDPAEYALVAFGGAGGMHTIGVAEKLGISEILLPQRAGILSAVGVFHASLEKLARRQILKPLPEVSRNLAKTLDDLSGEVMALLVQDGMDTNSTADFRYTFSLRFEGQESSLDIETCNANETNAQNLSELFQNKYRKIFGYMPEGRAIELVAVTAMGSSQAVAQKGQAGDGGLFTLTKKETHFMPAETSEKIATRCYFNGRWHPTKYLLADQFAANTTEQGPALLLDQHATAVIPPGWSISRR